ncbi:hypothetical protein D869_gp138 [Caulobacter phage CcrRogue]|uniref:Uncharacterized protein n=1 Tax=Caulobacter phage CcrRogue TaxID=2927986 RepID=K4JP37_9CAUD|nr:hypothetical protein D869_gp138 [Caulobacter phage CcrRogue]AFU86776.1 hypothetical protein CcrRogue_gp294 [Caulobacter phage CcrRogue]
MTTPDGRYAIAGFTGWSPQHFKVVDLDTKSVNVSGWEDEEQDFALTLDGERFYYDVIKARFATAEDAVGNLTAAQEAYALHDKEVEALSEELETLKRKLELAVSARGRAYRKAMKGVDLG